MRTKRFIALVVACSLPLVGHAETVTGRRGGTATGTVTQKGNQVSGEVATTAANGKTASASGSATYHPATGSVSAQGSVTGPRGATHGGTVQASGGSATATSTSGKTKTFTKGTH